MASGFRDADLIDAHLIRGQDLDRNAVALGRFAGLGHVPQPFGDQSADGGRFGAFGRMEIQQILQAADVEAAGDDVAAIRLGAEIALGLVLVVDFADDFLHHVLHGDDARGGAVFIHHHGHVRAFFLHLAQQIVDRFGFGNGADGAHDVADFALARALRRRAQTYRAHARSR